MFSDEGLKSLMHLGQLQRTHKRVKTLLGLSFSSNLIDWRNIVSLPHAVLWLREWGHHCVIASCSFLKMGLKTLFVLASSIILIWDWSHHLVSATSRGDGGTEDKIRSKPPTRLGLRDWWKCLVSFSCSTLTQGWMPSWVCTHFSTENVKLRRWLFLSFLQCSDEGLKSLFSASYSTQVGIMKMSDHRILWSLTVILRPILHFSLLQYPEKGNTGTVFHNFLQHCYSGTEVTVVS